MNSSLPPTLAQLYTARQVDIQKRLQEFRSIPTEQLFYEIAFCLLTPQTNARSADEVIMKLQERNFYASPFDPLDILRDRTHYIRFHNVKAKRLLALAASFEEDILPVICNARSETFSSSETRALLLEKVNGFGLKETAHALRNIGVFGLAILDRHILRMLVECKVIREIPSSLTPKRYERIEKKFHRFAREINISIDELDLLFWCAATGEIFK